MNEPRRMDTPARPRYQFLMASRKLQTLPADLYAGQDNLPALRQVAERYAVAVTDAALATIETADDPIGRQYLPTAAELVTRPEENPDPIGDAAHEVVPGIIHRYPDRVLLMPVKVCAVYCRFCFRREAVGPKGNGAQEALSPAQLSAALDYIRQTPQIWEVILSGGDPLVLSPRRLRAIIADLEAIPHVRVIRLHTRVPVADPGRVTPELAAALRASKAVYVAIHVNHAREITPAAQAAFTALRRADCTLVSQSVLLRGINDNPAALEALFRTLVESRVKPYYLHHPDLAPGTGHFRLKLAEGQALVESLRGRLSGLCLPAYMLDIPGGHGKIPVGADYIERQDGRIILRDPSGGRHAYAGQ